jgi:hypothetical protein
MRDLPEHLKDFHEFLSSLVNDCPDTTRTKLYGLFYQRFPRASLSFGEALSIDHHLFGMNTNAWWRNAHRLPEPGDRVTVLGLDGRAVHVGVFTFSIEFDADNDAE